ncbi:branched-chain amino acid transaminase [Polyangium sp. 15x6]|uniref:branched-chain amino acid transaminase n=1 Tax=Polyangium sp. 15x6 TaxID=3042687 RepID=UPI00249C7B37|nr:branched-chain amino acid transaminase [Polyangium sp. 15x6]MDI3281705.1 branched-chain amino acid transaminase [Polyangium sp. 15x6]
MVDKLKKIWMEGEFVDWDDAKVHILTHSLHYGLGAFEGIRAYRRTDGGTYVFRLKEHIDRLFDTCRLLAIQPRFTRQQVSDATVEFLRQNDMQEGYIRPLVYMGDGPMGVYAHDNPVRTTVVGWHWGAYLGKGATENGIRAKISAFARHHINVGLPKAKMMGQYTNSSLAKREARIAGYNEAILLDPNGYVSEGSGENIFIVRRGRLLTPPLSASILEGITRDTILTLAREEGIPAAEEMITRDQLYLADEAFFTGTAAEVTPIREVDDRTIGEGQVGAITRRLQQRFFGIVRGEDNSHPEWLTRV